MNPTIEVTPRTDRQPKPPIVAVADFVEAHRESGLFDALHEACDQVLCGKKGLDLLEALVSTETGEYMSERVVAAFERLDWAIRGDVLVVEADDCVRVTIGAAGCWVQAEARAKGWHITGERHPLV